VQIHSRGAADCIDEAGWIGLGTPTDVTIEAPSWFLLEADFRRVYRMDVTGPSGSALEVWMLTYDSGGPMCYRPMSQAGATELTDDAGEIVWAHTADAGGVLVSPPAGVSPVSYTLTTTELAGPPAGSVQVVPAVASTPGALGTLFRSDLYLFNTRGYYRWVDLELVPSAGAPAGDEVSLQLAPQEIRRFEDVVASLFGVEQATGAIRVDGAGVVVASRTYNQTDDGTFGQAIGARSWWSSMWSPTWEDEAPRYLLGLASTPELRSNVGFVEVLGLDAEITLELRDTSGASIGQRQITIPAHSHHQINDVFAFVGAGEHAAASATVRVDSLARVLTYASVIDNRTGDPTYYPGLEDRGLTQLFPAAAATEGVHGARWQTDLHVLGRNGADGVQVTFLPTDGNSVEQELPLTGDGVLYVRDVVAALGASGSGALMVTPTGAGPDPYTRPSVLAVSRTYNRTDDGTYGQYIPADAVGVRHGTVLGVTSSQAYRTNIGMLIDGEQERDVLVSLISESGALRASRIWTLAPRAPVQVNDIFAALGVAPEDSCRVDFEVQGGFFQGSVRAYASIVDNRTGDAVYRPAIESAAETTARIELDNRSNAILIDELDAAVGTGQLPAGELTATVSGGGNLGRDDLPLRILCLYKSVVGELRSAALGAGETLSGIGGGEPFWCVIPDWISAADNTGELTVTLAGGGGDLVLEADGRDNAVLIDRQIEAVVQERPVAEAYQVTVTGDLGRPELEPQPFLMYRNGDTGALQVATPEHGEVVVPVDAGFRLAAAVLDWISREDNSGTTTFALTCRTRAVACGEAVAGTVTGQDCREGPRGLHHAAEPILFQATARSVVTLTAEWQDHLATGAVSVLDADGELLAETVAYPGETSSEIAGLQLDAGETITIWVSTTFQGEPDPVAYVLSLECQ
jgi:hypothetical protein